MKSSAKSPVCKCERPSRTGQFFGPLRREYVGVTSLSGVVAKPGRSDPRPGALSAGITGLVEAAGRVLQIGNQQRLAQENIRRIRQGQAPISYQDIPGLVPTVQVEAGVDAGTQQTAMMIFGLGAALVAAFVLTGRKRRA